MMDKQHSDTLIVWDFHGVMETGNLRAVWELTNMALCNLGYHEQFTLEQFSALYGKKWYEFFMEQFGIDETRAKQIEQECFRLQQKHQDIMQKCIEPTRHVHDVLRKLKKHHHQILISSVTPDAFGMFLNLVKVHTYFTIGENAFASHHRSEHGEHKHDILSQQLVERYEDVAHVVLIGDSHTDMLLANHVGEKRTATRILYSHPEIAFRSEYADHRINNLADILDILDIS